MPIDSLETVFRRTSFKFLVVCGISDIVRIIVPSVSLWQSLFVGSAILLVAIQWLAENERVSMRLEPRPFIHWDSLVIDLGPFFHWCDRHGLFGDRPLGLGWADLVQRINFGS